MLGTNIPKSICFKLQIWVSHYFLVGRVKNTCSKIHLFQITNNGVSLFLGWLLSLFPTQIYILKNVSPTLKGPQTLPNLHSSANCLITTFIAQIGGCIYFLKWIFPNPTPQRSNNHSKWWVSNTNLYIQLTYTPKIVFSKYPTQRYILKYIYSPTMRPKGTQKLPNLHSSLQLLA